MTHDLCWQLCNVNKEFAFCIRVYAYQNYFLRKCNISVFVKEILTIKCYLGVKLAYLKKF